MADATATTGSDGEAGLRPAGRAAIEIGGGAAAGALLGRLVGRGTAATLLGAAAGAVAGMAVSLVTIGGRGRLPPRVSRSELGSPDHPSPRAGGDADSGRRENREEGGASADPGQTEPEAGGAAGSGRRTRREEYGSWTKARLYELAKERDLHGRSRMTKAELIDALLERDTTSSA